MVELIWNQNYSSSRADIAKSASNMKASIVVMKPYPMLPRATTAHYLQVSFSEQRSEVDLVLGELLSPRGP